MRALVALLATALAFAAPAPVTAEAGDVGEQRLERVWLNDFDKAAAKAKKERKDLLVDFAGSDWCVWCVKLNDEVFESPTFVPAATSRYVLVLVDFPRGPEAKANVPHPARNDELQRKYRIQGYPTVLLMTPDGDVFGQLGYEEGGARNWLASLEKREAEGRTRLAAARSAADAVAAARPEEKDAAWDEAIAALEALEPAGVGTDVLAAPVKAAFVSDPANAAGRAARAARALVEKGVADESVLASLQRLDPKNEKGLLELVGSSRVDLQACKLEYSIVSPK